MSSQTNLMGSYGEWVDSITADGPSELSFRHESRTDRESWRATARELVSECLSRPETGGVPETVIEDQYSYDGLRMEELSWRLPYGNPTKAVLLKPEDTSEKLPGILALHDHSGDKYFSRRKIVKTRDTAHSLMKDHRERLYGGDAWANEIAKRGYVVLVHDGFTFGNRRIRPEKVPEDVRDGVSGRVTEESDSIETEEPDSIEAYNRWAGDYESVIAKSLFCASTTWPGVMLAEDQRALDVLCDRNDVDETRIGCGGLSGGGLRTVYLGGMDPRIRCAVCAGMMTTWRDFMLNKAHHHTWMVYTPLLARSLEYPEIFTLRVPRAALVLNNRNDHLFTMEEMERADDIIRAVYDKAGVSDRYQCSYYPGSHKFDREMQTEAFEWFDRMLAAVNP